MGCKMSKLAGEPRTIIIRLPSGCSTILRSFSSPPPVEGEEYVSRKPNVDSFHAVSLTSSTYGSLQLDPLEDYGGERSRRGSSDFHGDMTFENISNSVNRPVSKGPNSWSGATDSSLSTSGRNRDNRKVIPFKGSNNDQVEIIDMWELMEGVEDTKETLKMLRAAVEKPSMSGYDSGKSTPRLSTTIHTVEDVDNALDDRKSFPTGYQIRRGSSLEAVVPVHASRESGLDSHRMTGRTSAMLQKRRARAMQISKEVLSELDELRRRNLSRSQEFNASGKNIVSRSQEFITAGRKRSQEFNSAGRTDLSRSQEFNTAGRTDLSRSQEFNTAGRTDLSRSQEFNSAGRNDMSRGQEFNITERSGLSRSHEFNAAGRRYLSQSQDYDSTGRNRHIRSPNLDHVRRGNLFRNQEHDSRKGVHGGQIQESTRPPLAKPRDFVARRHSSHEISSIVGPKDERVNALSKPDIVLRSPMLRGTVGVERQRVHHGQESSMSSAAIDIESTNKPSLRSQILPHGRKTMLKAAGPTMANLDLNT